jgi:hypothetical protein
MLEACFNQHNGTEELHDKNVNSAHTYSVVRFLLQNGAFITVYKQKSISVLCAKDIFWNFCWIKYLQPTFYIHFVLSINFVTVCFIT